MADYHSIILMHFALFFKNKLRGFPKQGFFPIHLCGPPPPRVCGQALRFAGAWLRASWLSAISGASRPPLVAGFGLRLPFGLSSSSVLRTLKLVCGKCAAARELGAPFRKLNRRLWHCRAKSSFRLTAVSR